VGGGAVKLVYPKKPCAECPWRTDVEPGAFTADRFRALANTAHDMAMSLFACHKSGDDRPTVCAGFLLRGGRHNLTLRLAYARGEIVPEGVDDGGYPLFADYRAMAVANGVPADDPALRLCRGRA
jgi:hypothetical protein